MLVVAAAPSTTSSTMSYPGKGVSPLVNPFVLEEEPSHPYFPAAPQTVPGSCSHMSQLPMRQDECDGLHPVVIKMWAWVGSITVILEHVRNVSSRAPSGQSQSLPWSLCASQAHHLEAGRTEGGGEMGPKAWLLSVMQAFPDFWI